MHGLVEHIAGRAKLDGYDDGMVGGERRRGHECEIGRRGCAGQAADAITK